MRNTLDWVSRVVMLVLAGLVSLSIIGSIAAIPSGSIASLDDDGPSYGPSPTRTTEPDQQQSFEAARGDQAPGMAGGEAGTAIEVAPKEEEADPARWLEAITYALIALVGLAALATLILWRTLHERRRIADALEHLARR